MSSRCPHNMVNFGPLAAEIVSSVWGIPKFQLVSRLGSVTERNVVVSGVASIGPGRALARPLIGQVGPGQARFGCVHNCCLSENNYFDKLNFTFDCHDYIAVTHNRNCNRLSIPSTSSADVLYKHVFICSRIITPLSHRSLRYQLTQSFSVYKTCTRRY